ncbi:MAG: DUF3078 domain-containing protein [Muribaculaceae bacterium]|nr:DUF3078 domain-containing protein [Muribaculaceae bacterium]
MRQPKRFIALISVAALSSVFAAPYIEAQTKFRHVARTELQREEQQALEEARIAQAIADSIAAERTRVRSVEEIIESLGEPDFTSKPVNRMAGPWIFTGYRSLARKGLDLSLPAQLPPAVYVPSDTTASILSSPGEVIEEAVEEEEITQQPSAYEPETSPRNRLDVTKPGEVPKWLRDAINSFRIQDDFIYSTMVNDPHTIDYAYWDLPVPPRLLDDDVTFAGYIRRLNLPDVDLDKAIIPEEELKRKHWLHNFGAGIHLSQAYVSANWYQGGNNHLSFLFNFNWNVQLNQVYHPNILFQSALSYKLALNSTPQDEVHKYSISEDVLQYNLNTGVKAFKKWFYSLNALFKTQILTNYEQNSMKRTASFLSPGDLNVGLGMAYSHQNKLKTLQLTATISPLSYNLKTCITDKIDHSLFNIPADRKTRSEFGSNAEFNMLWYMTPNISYKTRVFLFTDYSYFLSDWENTVNFEINRFLSTQIYVHLRYDTSSEIINRWKHLQMREVLSFGLTYTFSTKP